MGNIHVKLYENKDQWFRRRCRFKEKVYRLTTDGPTNEGRRTKTDHNTSPSAFGSGELKSMRN